MRGVNMYGNGNLCVESENFAIHHSVYPVYRNLPFLLYDCGSLVTNPGYYEERKFGNSYFLVVGESGYGSVKYGNKEINIGPKEAVLLCSDNCTYSTKSNISWNFSWLHYDGMAAQEYLLFVTGNMGGKIILDDELYEIIEKNLKDIGTELKNGSKYIDLIVSSLINNIMTNLAVSRQYVENETSAKNLRYEDIEKVLEYIDNNYDKPLTIDTLTKIACMSRYHFFRVFKNCTQKSPYEYVQNKKLIEAKKLLFEDDITIQAISQKVSYSNLNNFIKDFKKMTGFTPNKYRNLIKLKKFTAGDMGKGVAV
jgi:AraC-like DNA-binding protein